MRDHWWQHETDHAVPLPPATLRHLPVLRTANTQALRGRQDTPVARAGYVKRWRARAVNLARLLYPPPLAPPATATGHAGTSEAARVAEMTRLARERQDALARRLLAVLQPPPAVLLNPQGPLH
jgi:hypothetical protein